jgi:hydroxymethylbilane synthase
MKNSILRIATRKSPLALWQANHVKNALLAIYPDIQVEIQGLSTEGDRLLSASLANVGGKGLFVKELDTALLENAADIAVHSVKDIPVCATPGLALAAYCEREDPRDAFLSPRFSSILDMPSGAIVGTSSSRRACLLRDLRPDLTVLPLRGNVGTRIKKLEEGQYDAIILAAAGLKRLGESARIRSYLEVETWIPAVGQGVVGIACREKDSRVLGWLQSVDHAATRACVLAERAFNAALEGGCQLPIAAHAFCVGNALHLLGFIAHPSKNESLYAQWTAPLDHPEAAGRALVDLLLEKGAAAILQEIRNAH